MPALDPLLGRFISADTIVPDKADPQSLNRFAYSLNNPVKYVDPLGYSPSETESDTNSNQLSKLIAQYEAKYAVQFRRFTDIDELRLVTSVLDSYAQKFGSVDAFNYVIKQAVKVRTGKNSVLILDRENDPTVTPTAGWLPDEGRLAFGNGTFDNSLNYFSLNLQTQGDLIAKIVIGHEFGHILVDRASDERTRKGKLSLQQQTLNDLGLSVAIAIHPLLKFGNIGNVNENLATSVSALTVGLDPNQAPASMQPLLRYVKANLSVAPLPAPRVGPAPI